MTNGWTDIRNADVVLAMSGREPSRRLPVRDGGRRNRNAKLVSVDPRFNRTAAVADRFAQIRAGTDIAFVGGLINYALTHDRIREEYVRLYTNARCWSASSPRSTLRAASFSGRDEASMTYSDTSSWSYEIGADGFAVADPALQHPDRSSRC
jgi:formate dehydrogenase major subunit